MTTNHDYNTPEAGTTDWHIPLNDNFDRIDTDVEIRDVESNLSDYEPKQDAKFLSTDTERVFLGDGEQWTEWKPTIDADGGGWNGRPWRSSENIDVRDYPTVNDALADIPVFLGDETLWINVPEGRYKEVLEFPTWFTSGKTDNDGRPAGIIFQGPESGTATFDAAFIQSFQGQLMMRRNIEFVDNSDRIDQSNDGMIQIDSVGGHVTLSDIDFSSANGSTGIAMQRSPNVDVDECNFGDHVLNDGFRQKGGHSDLLIGDANSGTVNDVVLELSTGWARVNGSPSLSGDNGFYEVTNAGMLVEGDGTLVLPGNREI